MTPIKRISRETLTQKQLKAVLHYDPDTGVFTWTKSFAGHRQKGKQAGSLGPKYSKGNLVYKQRNIKINGKIYLASRLAWLYMTGEFPTFPTNEIDHINHNPMDNSWTNLRAVNKKMNARNRSLNTNNKSGITGVFWNKNDRRWIAQIRAHGKAIYLGSFHKKDDAAKARKLVEKEYGFHQNHGKSLLAERGKI